MHWWEVHETRSFRGTHIGFSSWCSAQGSVDKELVKKIYYYFKKYSDEDLESFSHDDPAWSKTWYERQDDNDRMNNKELSSFYQKLLGHVVKEIELS